MTDRELLELAAKAAGADHNGYRFGENGREPLYAMPTEEGDSIRYQHWDPLTDDGDALRLAVKLRLDIYSNTGAIIASDGPNRAEERNVGDRYVATRRAIVRAAAEIGRAMP